MLCAASPSACAESAGRLGQVEERSNMYNRANSTVLTTADILAWLQRREQQQQQQQHQQQPAHPPQQLPHRHSFSGHSYDHQQMTHYTSYPSLSPPQQHNSPFQTTLPQHPAAAQGIFNDVSPQSYDHQQPHLAQMSHMNGTTAQPVTPGSSQNQQGSQSQQSQKQNRLRKACDSCSIRKVKCDESGPPCKACAALDIPCTFERPSRRRGPPNRHAEAIKRQRLEADNTASASPMPPSPSLHSPVYAAQSNTLSAESICPIELVNLLIDDFFNYIYPLNPFPHEIWFRESFKRRRDKHDRTFLALLAAMIGSLVAAYPRRPRRHLRALHLEHLFASSMEFVRRCHHVCCEARGPGYLERSDIGVYDAATSYLLFSMCAHTYRAQPADLYLGECFTMIRTLGLHRPDDELEDSKPIDRVEQEIARRVYWTIFVTVRSATSFGGAEAMSNLNMHPPTPTRPHPPLPADVDDAYITPEGISAPLDGKRSLLSGFLTNLRVYLSYDRLVAAELSYGVDNVYNVERQKKALQDCLDEAKTVFTSLPEAFSVWLGPPSRSPSSSDAHSILKYEFSAEFDPDLDSGSPEANESARRAVGFEIQKANIHASLLSTRSYFVEKFWSLCKRRKNPNSDEPETANMEILGSLENYRPNVPSVLTRNPNPNEAEIRAEREIIANDLLNVLSSVRPIHMEPNSVSFLMKIRQIASTLLPSNLPVSNAPADGSGDGAKLPSDGTAAYYLEAFLEVLTDLDKGMSGGAAASSSGNGYGSGVGNEGNEEEELRRWADLRQYQRQFATRNSTTSG